MKQNIIFLILVLFILGNTPLWAQQDPEWDNTKKNHWRNEFVEVDIPSSVDGVNQKAYVYKSRSSKCQLLIVSLHTWSGNYIQKDPLVDEIVARDWNYIHPNFRGPNNHPDAMGSPLVISDIEDAIRFAVEYTKANPQEVHIVGVSGGGYATLLSYMNIVYPVKSFSAWASISDIEDWYWESVGRGQKYAKDILKSISAKEVFNPEEAARRSPLKHIFPSEKRKDSDLYIYAGIHDGYKGSVPITHSINIYNRLVSDIKYGTYNADSIALKSITDKDLVSQTEIISLLSKRIQPYCEKKQSLYGRNIYLSRDFNRIHLTIFEGKHEQIPQALGLIPYQKTVSLKCNILTIGDSNAQNKGGWVEQLKVLMPKSKIINISKGGRTIGFDNNGNPQLNALKNINSYLDEAQKLLPENEFDYIIVNLGTNDSKKDFEGKQDEVITNFDLLLSSIKDHDINKKTQAPRLIFVTPPPIRATDISSKYEGSSERLDKMVPQLISTAKERNFEVVDIYHPLLGIIDYYASDGVHMSEEGQSIIALKILEEIQREM